jgi:hypothetical protein
LGNLESDERRLLRAAIDCIIPRDQDPGATDLDADAYIVAELAADHADDAAAILSGLAALDAEAMTRHGSSFERLDRGDQNALIAEIERQDWFVLLCELTAEGYYADPGNGGNREARSWTMVGYEHRLPDGPSGIVQPSGNGAEGEKR